MSRDDRDRALHDYLDGRMSAPDRARFEALVASDRELAERVAFHRAVGSALREPIEGPRPGFAARARARFEATERRRPGFRRLLRWEAAGLAVASVLLALLVLPEDRRRELLPPPPSSPQTESTDLSSGIEGNRLAVPSPPTRQRSQALSDGKKREDAPAFTPAPAPAPVAGLTPTAPPASAAREEADDLEQKQKEAPRDEVAAGAAVAEPEALDRRSAAERVGASPAPLGSLMKADAGAGVAQRGRPLPQGTLSDNAVERVGERPHASKDVRSNEQDVLKELQPIDDRYEVLLVGPRAEPFSCENYRVELTSTALRVFLDPPLSGEAVSRGGCAFVIPRSTLPVIVEDFRDAGR